MEYLIFNESSIITHMCSKDREEVPLLNKIDPNNSPVEIWCRELENEMIETLKDLIYKSVINYSEIPRKQWVRTWYTQLVLNGSQVHWTKETEEAIHQNKLSDYWTKTNNQIMDLVELIRLKLSKLEKKSISPLIVQGVHERDIIKKLTDSHITTIFEYEWVSQLRF